MAQSYTIRGCGRESDRAKCTQALAYPGNLWRFIALELFPILVTGYRATTGGLSTGSGRIGI